MGNGQWAMGNGQWAVWKCDLRYVIYYQFSQIGSLGVASDLHWFSRRFFLSQNGYENQKRYTSH